MEPSVLLLTGRRALDRERAIKVIEDWKRFGRDWALRIRITIENSSASIPLHTDWYLLTEADYPQGRILMVPAKTNSIKDTFRHQRYNGEGSPELPWRQGNICLSTNELRSGSLISPVEPWNAKERLLWCAQRGIAWLIDASQGKLAIPGQPYELTDFPSTDKDGIIGYNEDSHSLDDYKEIPLFGTGSLYQAKVNQKLFFLTELRDLDGKLVKSFDWGLGSTGESISMCWLRLSAAPIIEPWQAPVTFGELQKVCAADGLDLYRVLRSGYVRLGVPNSFLCVIGFPIPETIGGSLVQMHWQSFRTSGLEKIRGVRDSIEPQWHAHCQRTIGINKQVPWLVSENWAKDQLKSRGSLPESLKQKILLIGAGAVGSVVAENLIRGGVIDITIMDPQEVAVGNLVRHTLDLASVCLNKASELAKRLNAIGPHVKARALAERFRIANDGKELVDEEYDLIIDCTATDHVPLALAKLTFHKVTRFASFSITQGADKLLLFCSEGTSYDSQKFYELMNPILESEIYRLAKEPLPREGIGCFHPVFPAAYHDIAALVGFAIKRLAAVSLPWQMQLQVFSNTADGINLFWHAGERPRDA